MGWIAKIFGVASERKLPDEKGTALIREAAPAPSKQAPGRTAGFVKGAHYTNHVDDIKQLKRDGNIAEAVELLLQLVDAVEAEAAANRWGVAPWYYEQLAILYRKEKRYPDEVAILERYLNQKKASGVKPGKLAERLAKARELAQR